MKNKSNLKNNLKIIGGYCLIICSVAATVGTLVFMGSYGLYSPILAPVVVFPMIPIVGGVYCISDGMENKKKKIGEISNSSIHSDNDLAKEKKCELLMETMKNQSTPQHVKEKEKNTKQIERDISIIERDKYKKAELEELKRFLEESKEMKKDENISSYQGRKL